MFLMAISFLFHKIDFNWFTSQLIGQGRSSLQLLVSSRIGQDAPSYWACVSTSLLLWLCPGSPHLQDLEQELHSLQALTWVNLLCNSLPFYGVNFDWFTVQLIGQWKSLQLLVASRTGQGIPPWSASVLTILARWLSPKPHGFEQELQLFQALTCVCFFAIPFLHHETNFLLLNHLTVNRAGEIVAPSAFTKN